VPAHFALTHRRQAEIGHGLPEHPVSPDQQVIGSKQGESVPPGDGKGSQEIVLERGFKGGGGRLRHVRRYHRQCLPAVIEGGSQEKLRYPDPVQQIDAGPFFQVIEFFADGQGCRGDDNSPEFIENYRFDRFRDLDRG